MQMKFVNSKTNAAATAKSLHLCPTLCEPIDGSPPGSPVPGIFQARALEWVAISFSAKTNERVSNLTTKTLDKYLQEKQIDIIEAILLYNLNFRKK